MRQNHALDVPTAQEFLRFCDSPSTTNSRCPFWPARYNVLPLAGLQRNGGRVTERERERAKEEGGREGETRQDRAFSLEIITFTLLMYGQTTKDIRRQ